MIATTRSWNNVAVVGEQWGARAGHSSVVLNGTIYVMGGLDDNANTESGYSDDVWSSADGGKTWTEVNSSAAWPVRQRHSSVVLNGTIYVMGGDTDTGYSKDVWSSANAGKTWNQVSSAPWDARAGHSSVVLNGTIYVMGGDDGNADTSYLKDVWSSADGGKNWTNVSSSAPWDDRVSHSSVVLDGTIYVMGGINSDNERFQDVWSSADGGENWNQVSSAPWDARSSHSSVVLDGVIYVMGGSTSVGLVDDVWSSVDGGETWNQVSSAPWDARSIHSSVVLDGVIYVMGGFDDAILDDVWSTTTDLLD